MVEVFNGLGREHERIVILCMSIDHQYWYDAILYAEESNCAQCTWVHESKGRQNIWENSLKRTRNGAARHGGEKTIIKNY